MNGNRVYVYEFITTPTITTYLNKLQMLENIEEVVEIVEYDFWFLFIFLLSENPLIIYMINLQCQKGGRVFGRPNMYYVVCFCAVLCFQTFTLYRYKTDIKGRLAFPVRFASKIRSKCIFRGRPFFKDFRKIRKYKLF